MIDEEKVFAWLDGELGPEEASAVEAQVAVDEHLGALAAGHRRLQLRLAAAFDTVADLPIPEALRRAASREGEVVPLPTRTRTKGAWGVPQWAAMAATVAVGIFAGNMMAPRPTGPVTADGGKLYAAAALDRALDTQLASVPVGGPARVGLTFRDRGGAICRSFTERSDSGVACVDGDRWQIRGLFASGKQQQSDYRMAGGGDPNLMALVDSMIAGDPLDAAHEREARDRGWK